MKTPTDLMVKLRRSLGRCKRCNGFLELGKDDFYRPQAKCISCGREAIKYPPDDTNVDDAAVIEYSLRQKAVRRGA